ncbi:MAG: hypothetical protein BGO69_17445 [Bacteroidetes bacterium 46-16]|nr:MAG: hypothetical protein BGO69_17445 [Bacteroidetes bacterium 46-16]
MKCICAILLLYLCNCTQIAAVPDTNRLLHINLNNGFPSNNVYSLIQDTIGYLWFATDNGIVKYNGYDFKIFNSSNGLPASDVYQLYEDKRGRVWVQTFSYQFGYIKDNQYHKISLKTRERIFRAYDMADNGAFMFFSFVENGIFYLATVKNDLISTLPFFSYASPGMHIGNMQANTQPLVISPDCMAWCLSTDGSVYRYDMLKPYKSYEKVCQFSKEQSPVIFPGKMYMNAGHNFYYFSFKGSQLIFLDTRTCTVRYISFKNLPDEYIYEVLSGYFTHDSNNDYTVLTNYAIYTYDSNFVFKHRRKFADITGSPSQPSYLFNDDFGNQWYTTNTDGVWSVVKKYRSLVDDKRLSSLSDIKYVGSSHDGTTYWWNNSRSVLYILASNGTIKAKHFLHNTGLRSISDCDESSVYMALSSGISKYDRNHDKLHDIRTENKEWFIYHFDVDKRLEVNSDTVEKMYLGNHYGVRSYSPDCFFTIAVNGFYVSQQYKDSLVTRSYTDERYTGLYIDSVWRNVYAYNAQKILLYNIDTKRRITFDADYTSRLGIKEVLNIEVDGYGDIFIQDNDRIIMYNPFLNKVATIKRGFNLQNSIFHIYDNKLVMAGKYGIAMAPIIGPLIVGEFNLIPNINYAYYNRIYDFVLNGRYGAILNTDKGFYKISLSEFLTAKDLFYPAGEDFFRLILKYPYEKRINNGDTMIFDQASEKVNLDAINFYGKGSPAYSYYVEGYNNEWQQSDGEIFVGNFSPGKLYHVVCNVADDMWKSTTVHFYVYRTPYWWQTTKWILVFWISGITAIMVLLLLVVLATRAVVARTNEKKRALLELELRAVYAQINPHFIFNTLSAAQYFINKKRYDDAYVHVNKFSRLLRAYLKSSQDRYVTLDAEVQMLKNYIELQQIRFEEKFEYNVEIENKIPSQSIRIPSLLLQPLVENAINHGLFHKNGRGFLMIKFLQGESSGELICIIEDNGIGRHRAREIHKADSTRKESYGTKLTRQLIEIYKQYEHIDITLEYIDKGGSETGTIVKLFIKNVKYIA